MPRPVQPGVAGGRGAQRLDRTVGVVGAEHGGTGHEDVRPGLGGAQRPVAEPVVHAVESVRIVELQAELGGQAVDAFGATRVGFEARGEISRKEFGLTWNAAIEAGGMLVSDKVVLNLDVAFTAPQA